MSAMASQITSLTIVYSTVYSRRISKQKSKLWVTGLCEWNSQVTGEFPTQRASNAENGFDDVIMWGLWSRLRRQDLCILLINYAGEKSKYMCLCNFSFSPHWDNASWRSSYTVNMVWWLDLVLPLLVQVIACHLFGANPSLGPMLIYNKYGPREPVRREAIIWTSAAFLSIDQSHKSHNAPVPYHKIHHTETKMCIRPANERRRHKATPSLIGWAQTYFYYNVVDRGIWDRIIVGFMSG